MSLNTMRNREPSLQQSRVSSSSSSSSQGYELIPREEPFFNPTRDVASPRASFPFRKVQAGNQSMGSRSVNDSRSSIKGSLRDENQCREINEFGGQLNASIKEIERERESMRNSAVHEECRVRVKEANLKIEELQKKLEEERYFFDLERKANEIYTDGFAKIRRLILAKQKNLENESIEQMVQKLEELLQGSGVDHDKTYQIIQQQDRRIRELRAELVKSTQNNIAAIFNTEITETCLLQSQIQKMNMEIANLKEKLIQATADNQENLAKLIHHNPNHQIKIVKVSNWDSEEPEEPRRKRAHTRERPTSEHSHRNLINTENRFSQLIEGYKSLKDEYIKIVAVLTQINSGQADFKELFAAMKKDISVAIQTQLKDVKETMKRPSSSHEQLRIARDMEVKLNDLVNTLNAPEKVNIQRQTEDEDGGNLKYVDHFRRLMDVQAKNRELEQQLKRVSEERDQLQETVVRTYVHKPPLFSDI